MNGRKLLGYFAVIIAAIVCGLWGLGRLADRLVIEHPAPHPSTAVRPEIRRSEEIGDTIVAAIRKYHQSTGSWPDSLAQLVPTYLKEIPVAVAGRAEWNYVKCGESFGLSFEDVPSGMPYGRDDDSPWQDAGDASKF